MVMISRMIIVEKIQNTHRLEHMNSFLAYIKKNKDKSETATVSPSFCPSWRSVSHVVKGGKAGVGPLVLPLGECCRRGGGHYFLQLDAGVLARLDISALTLDPQMHPLNDASNAVDDDQQNDHHHCRYCQIVCILHCKNKKYYYLFYLTREKERKRNSMFVQ